MAITEHKRQKLFRALEDAIGVDNATTFMEMMPPSGWADVPTKRDLDHLRAELEARFDASLQREIAGVYREIGSLKTTLGTWIIAGNAATLAAISALKIFG